VVAAAGLAGLLFVWTGQQEPLPAWVVLPPDGTVQFSRYRPAAGKAGVIGGGPAYFLQIRCKGEAREAAEQLMGLVTGYTWGPGSVRKVTTADVIRRAQWPGWVREHLHKSQDTQSGCAVTGTGAGTADKLYIFAWPAEEGTIVELIEEAEAL
jgi:hypothetical protein